AAESLTDPAPVIAVRLQTLRNAAVGAHARSTDPALILLAGVGASFDFDFNDYLHIASLSAVPQPCATARNVQNPDLVHFPLGNFLTSSVIIVSPVSVNRLRAHNYLSGLKFGEAATSSFSGRDTHLIKCSQS